MNIQLSQRIAKAMYAGLATFAERQLIIDAVQGVESFNALPRDVRVLIKSLESRRRINN
jgi:hypothetical protein